MNKGLQIVKWTAISVLFVFLFGWITMILWNWLMPSIFDGARAITFWQSLGLLLLSKILFSGFGGKRWGGQAMHWKQKYQSRLSAMSPEERERFKARMTEKWCSREKTPSRANSDTSID